MDVLSRVGPDAVALETTLLVHGVPRGIAPGLAQALEQDIRAAGAEPALVGVVHGRPIVGMTTVELDVLLAEPSIPKVGSANLGLVLHRGRSAATTVSATMELAFHAGVQVFATGGLGGVHRGPRFDVSADLVAFTRFPVAVVSSGVKAILDVAATREALETLGVPVVGWRTDRFPAFYLRDGPAGVDARFDDLEDLAGFVRAELARTGRGVVIASPVPESDALGEDDWHRWLAHAEARVPHATGRDVTPVLLAALHEVSGGATLRANIALVRANARLAAALRREMSALDTIALMESSED